MGLRRAGANGHEEEVRRSEGESAAFEVQVEPDSVPSGARLQFAWLRDDAELTLGSRSGVQQTGLTSRLHISNLSTLDCGRYSCVALAHRYPPASKKHNANANGNGNSNAELRTHFRLHVAENLSDDDGDPSKALSARIRRLHRRRASSPATRGRAADLGRTESPSRGALDAAVNNNNEGIDRTSTADDAFRFWSPAFKRRRPPPPIGPKPKSSKSSSSSSAQSMHSPPSSCPSSPFCPVDQKSAADPEEREGSPVMNGTRESAKQKEAEGTRGPGGGVTSSAEDEAVEDAAGDRISLTEENRRADDRNVEQKVEEAASREEQSSEKTEESHEKSEESHETSEESHEKTEESHEKTEESQEKTEQSSEKAEESHEKTEESHEKTKESHEKTEESLEKTEESHETSEKSHEKTEESHEKESESQETSEESHEKSEESHEKSEESHEKESESHETSEESHEKSEESHEKSEESHEKSEESHEKTEERHEKSEESHEKSEESQEKTEESHEKTEESHEMSEESQEKTEESHEKTEESHEKSEESQEKTKESHEKSEESHEKSEESHEKSEKSQEKSEESHEKKEESHEKSEESHEKSEESQEKTEESHEKSEESHEKSEESQEKTEESHEKSEESHEKSEESHEKKEESQEKKGGVTAGPLTPLPGQEGSTANNDAIAGQSASREAVEGPEAEVGLQPAEVTLKLEAEAQEDMAEKVTLRWKGTKEEVEEAPFPDREVEIQVGKDPWKCYEQLEKIGSGGFSEVFRCQEIDSGLVLAAKVVRYRASNKASILYEVDILRGLKHPQVMRLYDVYDHSRRMTLISEYIAGGELCERIIEDNFLSEEQASYFVTQILRGVAYLHAQSVIHLDLKPENIVCATRTSYDIKIIDFGFAQRVDQGQGKEIRFLGGTANFTAPEVINYEPLNSAADIWAIGVMTYLLISGYAPFDGDNDQEVLVNVTRGVYDYEDEAFETISNAARDFIDSILVKQPSKRPTAEQLRRHDWLRCRGHRSTLHLPNAVSHLRNYVTKARGKWVKATNAIIAVQKFSRAPV